MGKRGCGVFFVLFVLVSLGACEEHRPECGTSIYNVAGETWDGDTLFLCGGMNGILLQNMVFINVTFILEDEPLDAFSLSNWNIQNSRGNVRIINNFANAGSECLFSIFRVSDCLGLTLDWEFTDCPANGDGHHITFSSVQIDADSRWGMSITSVQNTVVSDITAHILVSGVFEGQIDYFRVDSTTNFDRDAEFFLLDMDIDFDEVTTVSNFAYDISHTGSETRGIRELFTFTSAVTFEGFRKNVHQELTGSNGRVLAGIVTQYEGTHSPTVNNLECEFTVLVASTDDTFDNISGIEHIILTTDATFNDVSLKVDIPGNIRSRSDEAVNGITFEAAGNLLLTNALFNYHVPELIAEGFVGTGFSLPGTLTLSTFNLTGDFSANYVNDGPSKKFYGMQVAVVDAMFSNIVVDVDVGVQGTDVVDYSTMEISAVSWGVSSSGNIENVDMDIQHSISLGSFTGGHVFQGMVFNCAMNQVTASDWDIATDGSVSHNTGVTAVQFNLGEPTSDFSSINVESAGTFTTGHVQFGGVVVLDQGSLSDCTFRFGGTRTKTESSLLIPEICYGASVTSLGSTSDLTVSFSGTLTTSGLTTGAGASVVYNGGVFQSVTGIEVLNDGTISGAVQTPSAENILQGSAVALEVGTVDDIEVLFTGSITETYQNSETHVVGCSFAVGNAIVSLSDYIVENTGVVNLAGDVSQYTGIALLLNNSQPQAGIVTERSTTTIDSPNDGAKVIVGIYVFFGEHMASTDTLTVSFEGVYTFNRFHFVVTDTCGLISGIAVLPIDPENAYTRGTLNDVNFRSNGVLNVALTVESGGDEHIGSSVIDWYDNNNLQDTTISLQVTEISFGGFCEYEEIVFTNLNTVEINPRGTINVFIPSGGDTDLDEDSLPFYLICSGLSANLEHDSTADLSSTTIDVATSITCANQAVGFLMALKAPSVTSVTIDSTGDFYGNTYSASVFFSVQGEVTNLTITSGGTGGALSGTTSIGDCMGIALQLTQSTWEHFHIASSSNLVNCQYFKGIYGDSTQTISEATMSNVNFIESGTYSHTLTPTFDLETNNRYYGIAIDLLCSQYAWYNSHITSNGNFDIYQGVVHSVAFGGSFPLSRSISQIVPHDMTDTFIIIDSDVTIHNNPDPTEGPVYIGSIFSPLDATRGGLSHQGTLDINGSIEIFSMSNGQFSGTYFTFNPTVTCSETALPLKFQNVNDCSGLTVTDTGTYTTKEYLNDVSCDDSSTCSYQITPTIVNADDVVFLEISGTGMTESNIQIRPTLTNCPLTSNLQFLGATWSEEIRSVTVNIEGSSNMEARASNVVSMARGEGMSNFTLNVDFEDEEIVACTGYVQTNTEEESLQFENINIEYLGDLSCDSPFGITITDNLNSQVDNLKLLYRGNIDATDTARAIEFNVDLRGRTTQTNWDFEADVLSSNIDVFGVVFDSDSPITSNIITNFRMISRNAETSFLATFSGLTIFNGNFQGARTLFFDWANSNDVTFCSSFLQAESIFQATGGEGEPLTLGESYFLHTEFVGSFPNLHYGPSSDSSRIYADIDNSFTVTSSTEIAVEGCAFGPNPTFFAASGESTLYFPGCNISPGTDLPPSCPIPPPSPSPVPSPSPAFSPSPAPTPSPFPTPSSSPTPSPSSSPTPSPSSSPTPSPSPFPIPSPSPSPTPVLTEIPSPTPAVSPSPTPEFSPSPTPVPSPNQPEPMEWIYSQQMCNTNVDPTGTADGLLFLCLPSGAVPPGQDLSVECSDYFTHTREGDDCLVSFRFGPALVQIANSELLTGDIITISGVDFRVPDVPTPVFPFSFEINGVGQIVLPGGQLCWTVVPTYSGGRGVTYTATSDDEILTTSLSYVPLGMEISGNGEFCISSDAWSSFTADRSYTFTVEAQSTLFGTTATQNHSFYLASSTSNGDNEKKRSARQTSSCDPDLWDASPSSLFTIQTFPSVGTVFPPTLRAVSLTISAKALSPCDDIGFSKDILSPAEITWAFIDPPSGLDGVDPNDWADGTNLVIPVTVLQDRANFPFNEFVRISFTADFGTDTITFTAESSVKFLPSPVVLVTNPAVRFVIDATDTLVLDFSDSATDDGIEFGVGSDYTWEWEWECFVPLGVTDGGKSCEYSGGNQLVMPGSGDVRFESDSGETFEIGVPLMFVVKATVFDADTGEPIAHGHWEKVFSPVASSGLDLEFVADRFSCGNGGAVGYSARIQSTGDTIQSSELESLWSEDADDFGNLEALEITSGGTNGITQIRCVCGELCSEPVFMQATVRLDGEDHLLFYIYEASGILPPNIGDGCSSFAETFDPTSEQSGDVLSAMSLVGFTCDTTFFLNGVVAQQVWFQVTNDGEGVVSNPATYPPEKNYFSTVQLFLSCGSEVTIFIRSVGYGFDGGPVYSEPVSINLVVDSWENGQESQFEEAQNVIESSANGFLNASLGFAILQTTNLRCFPEGTFTPIDSEAVVGEILDAPIPEDVNDILNEASVISLVSSGDGGMATPEQQTQVIDRFGDYLSAVAASGDPDAVASLGSSISNTASNILSEEPTTEVLDEVYELVEQLETSILCSLRCGEGPTQINSDLVQLGASLDLLENLQTITLGGLTFTLPPSLAELQEELGGEGSCVEVGYSLINQENAEAPAASLSFYTIDCATGEWIDIPITLSDTFLISIPLDESPIRTETNECGEEVEVVDEPTCVSGDSLTGITDSSGCKVQEVTDTAVVCACTHLTAFSALFAPGSAEEGECGEAADWEWGTLQTVAVTLIAVCIALILLVILLEHNLKWKPMMAKMNATLEDC